MKIRNYWFLIVLGFCMLMMPYTAKAGSVSVSLSCPGAANVGDQITCNVNVSSDVNVNGLSGNYSLSGLSYVNFAPQNGFTTYASSASGFAVGNTSGGKSGNFTIGVITLKVGGAGSIQLTNLDASDVDINSYSIGTKSASIRIKSTNNDLSSIRQAIRSGVKVIATAHASGVNDLKNKKIDLNFFSKDYYKSSPDFDKINKFLDNNKELFSSNTKDTTLFDSFKILSESRYENISMSNAIELIKKIDELDKLIQNEPIKKSNR